MWTNPMERVEDGPPVGVELVGEVAVRAQRRGENAAVAVAAQFKNRGPCPVAEQHAGGAVGPVEDAGRGFGADDQRAAWPCRS